MSYELSSFKWVFILFLGSRKDLLNASLKGFSLKTNEAVIMELSTIYLQFCYYRSAHFTLILQLNALIGPNNTIIFITTNWTSREKGEKRDSNVEYHLKQHTLKLYLERSKWLIYEGCGLDILIVAYPNFVQPNLMAFYVLFMEFFSALLLGNFLIYKEIVHNPIVKRIMYTIAQFLKCYFHLRHLIQLTERKLVHIAYLYMDLYWIWIYWWHSISKLTFIPCIFHHNIF